MWFISPAYAQAAGAAPAGLMGNITSILPILGVGLVFYFFMIRPQQQQAKAHKAMLASVKRGDRVAMKGGLIGKVVRVYDTELNVEIAEGVRVQMDRSQLDRILAKTDPAKGGKAAKDADDDADDSSDQTAADAPTGRQASGK